MARQLLVACAAAAMLAACSSGSQPSVGLTPGGPAADAAKEHGVPSPALRNVAVARPNLEESWISPDARRAPRLLFISDYGASDVQIFTMPDMVLKGTLTGFSFPEGACSDASGNIWIANTGGLQILEYSRTGTLLNTLSDAYGYPSSCAFDKSGNLAVANIEGPSGTQGNIVIYANASGSGTTYTNKSVYEYFFVGYDPSGNLFFDGTDSSRATSYLGELPAGSSNTTLITLAGGTLHLAGFVQWDRSGSYLALGDQLCNGSSSSCVYWVTFTGSTGSIIGITTPLNYAGGQVCDLVQGVIAAWGDHYLTGADYETCGYTPITADRWNWPFGGKPTNYNNTASFTEPIGAAISTK